MRPVFFLAQAMALAGLATAQTYTSTYTSPTTTGYALPTTTEYASPRTSDKERRNTATETATYATPTETAVPTAGANVQGPVAGLAVVCALCAALL
ncbi:hypothetical protein C8A03DRAFT_33133 [Achaetomium macrosporum]|uniref:Uncharacterized protein n=1 Tax=Achaetomium macrosporum TaxID=79813 RepID=A0AAN7CB54_9PEZI|nr:hypothetical protein C8A03DRAFT_33133 [Achaetomium macrosporum]